MSGLDSKQKANLQLIQDRARAQQRVLEKDVATFKKKFGDI
jgi:hypothetical protein